MSPSALVPLDRLSFGGLQTGKFGHDLSRRQMVVVGESQRVRVWRDLLWRWGHERLKRSRGLL